jgi:uncharacterized caspase-like protein
LKKALIVGINEYENFSRLQGCVNDAVAIATTLETNGDGSPNFSVRMLISDRETVSKQALDAGIRELFSGEAETVLFYFAGHGVINPSTHAGYLVTQDGARAAWGMSLGEIIGLANRAHPKIHSTVIILDSCHSGFAGEAPEIANEQISAIGAGVTILTSCHRSGEAAEIDGHGLFTEILLDGMRGGSADICGRITPAALYSHVDQTLGPWEQRPVYKANVQSFVTVREVNPKVALETLRRLPEYFPDPTSIFSLDPSFEPDRENVPTQFRDLPVDEDHARIFKELQACNRVGLVTPVEAEHMYVAAIESKGCRLTALGAHYRRLAQMKRI